ncbi:MAG TPA: acyl-CoA dehydrogenase family protein [Candidatus Limnocylindria bacterium]|jgi:acyl-CoA dehydrogenase|nr:acyl-CoA dehydrogenase family protein [Candidatus Limnocylindria bacterium]
MDFDIPDELQLLARTVRDFVETRLVPIEKQVEERDDIPNDVVRDMAALGFFGLPFPEEYGGAGAGDLGYCLALEQFGRTSAAFSNLIGAHTSIGSMSIYLGGTDAQKRRYLPDLTAGRKLAAFSLTEPSSGSDAASIQTTARKDGGRWLLNGTKIWVTNGPIADVVVVYAANDRAKGARGGITAFIVEKGMRGFRVGKVDEKMGLRGSKTGELVFEDCEVPEENVLGGEPGTGFRTALGALDIGRVSLAAGAVGTSQYLLELGIAHAKRRKQFGQPIAANEAIQWMLADSAVEIHAARLMVYDAASKLDRRVRASREAAMVKVYASELANRVADRVLQIHGGMGYMKDSPVERAYRDVRILRIYEGTSEVQRMIIAEDLLTNARPV